MHVAPDQSSRQGDEHYEWLSYDSDSDFYNVPQTSTVIYQDNFDFFEHLEPDIRST